jgi:hypothetical protein
MRQNTQISYTNSGCIYFCTKRRNVGGVRQKDRQIKEEKQKITMQIVVIYEYHLKIISLREQGDEDHGVNLVCQNEFGV